MRYVGCLLIALAGAGMGLCAAHRLRCQARYVRQAARLLQALECKLPYTAQPMAVLWRQLAVSGVYDDCRLLQDTVAELDRKDGFSAAYTQAVEQAQTMGLLTPAGYSLLLECGAGCGTYDLVRQTEHLHHYRVQMEDLAGALAADAAVRGRLYRVLGVAGGVAVSLLLL